METLHSLDMVLNEGITITLVHTFPYVLSYPERFILRKAVQTWYRYTDSHLCKGQLFSPECESYTGHMVQNEPNVAR